MTIIDHKESTESIRNDFTPEKIKVMSTLIKKKKKKKESIRTQ